MAAYRRTPWLKRVLIPFWILRFLLMGFLLSVYIYAVVIAIQGLEENGSSLTSTIIAAIVIIALIGFCLFLDITAVFMFAYHSLNPLLFLIFNIIQTGVWIALFVLDLLGAIENNDDESSIYKNYGGWIVSFITLAVFIGLLIYSSIVFHGTRVAGRRQSIDFSAKDDHYPYQSETSFDAYRLPPQTFVPLTINRTSTQLSLESRRSQHIDLNTIRPKTTSETFTPYAPRKPSPLSNSESVSSPDDADSSDQSTQEHRQSNSPLNTNNISSTESLWTPPHAQKPVSIEQIPMALMPGQGSPRSTRSTIAGGEYFVSKQSLNEYQKRMYGQGVGETYELPAAS